MWQMQQGLSEKFLFDHNHQQQYLCCHVQAKLALCEESCLMGHTASAHDAGYLVACNSAAVSIRNKVCVQSSNAASA